MDKFLDVLFGQEAAAEPVQPLSVDEILRKLENPKMSLSVELINSIHQNAGDPRLTRVEAVFSGTGGGLALAVVSDNASSVSIYVRPRSKLPAMDAVYTFGDAKQSHWDGLAANGGCPQLAADVCDCLAALAQRFPRVREARIAFIEQVPREHDYYVPPMLSRH